MLEFIIFSEDNFLIRKRCSHRDVFDCDCSDIEFDVVLSDFDYAHNEGANIRDPECVGTYQYRALSLLVCICVVLCMLPHINPTDNKNS